MPLKNHGVFIRGNIVQREQKVHGVAYTRQQTKPEDWYVVFGP